MYVRVLFLLVAFAHLIKADYSSEAKYIDLLPENEKTEFLNRIARRIISEIKSRRGTQKTSVEISDERLNEHDAYVKKIIDEESQDMQNERRTEDAIKSERNGDDDFVELKVKPLEKSDQTGQESLENVDLSASENKIRIKKGTPETNTQRSKENIDDAEDTHSTVPVHLLYNDGSTLPEITIDENLGHSKTNHAPLENTQTNDNQQIIDLNDESKSRESKHEVNKMVNIASSLNSKENEDLNFPKTQTVIYDFEPRHDDVIEYKNDTTEKSSEIVRAKQFELDEASDKWIEIQSKNVTEAQLETSSAASSAAFNNTEEVTLKDEELSVTTIESFQTDYMSTSTNNISNISEYVLKSHNDSGGTDLQKENTISANKSAEYNTNVTESNLQPATPSNIYTTLTSTIQVRSASNEGKNEGSELFSGSKPILRLTKEDVNDLNEQLRFNDHPYSYSPNGNRDQKRFQVFGVAPNKPSVQNEEINSGFSEAPYYVPVYNYAPNNAFYNPYNRFGPYNGNNPELTEIEGSDNKDLGYEPSKINSGPEYEQALSNLKNIKDRNQRTFKHYQNYDDYGIDGRIPYQKVPVLKGKVINIHFNPNDYLDMDYYLGRSNDNPKQSKHEFKKEKPLPISHSLYTSGEGIDPISKKSRNVKDVISNIRMQMNSLKMENKSRTMTITRNRSEKLKDKLRIVDKILANPIFRGLNSLVVLIPKTRTKDVGTKETNENNIAVDYYFSRMSSGEGPYTDDKIEMEQKHKMYDDEITELLKKHFLKTEPKKKQTQIVTQEQLKIPLKEDNVLKFDLEMKDNNVNVLLQKVQKPKQSDFEVLLNAYLSVLKDMIEYNNKGLLKYDWLGSAVDVQSALEKLITLSNIMHVRDDVHYYDRELFKYVLFIFKTSLYSLLEAEEIKKQLKKANTRRNGMEKSIRSRMVPDIDILHRFAARQEVRKYMKEMRNLNIEVYDYILKQFEDFLSDLRDNLNELHEAIRAIASVTKYDRQRWFLDLKDLYLTPLDKKVSLTLLLHLVSTRLFGLIEESAKNGLEEDFVAYARNHKMEVERTKEEFVLLLRLLKELNRLKK